MNLETRVRDLLGSKADQKRDKSFFARYHGDFESSGVDKARMVLDDFSKREKLNIARCAYFSIGGSTGSEIFHVLTNSEIGYGLLIEYDPDASSIAQDRANQLSQQSKELKVITGDATQQLPRCKDQLLEWRDSKKIDGLIVSAQAVLHELQFRSPGFDLSHFFGEITWDWDPLLFYSREPCSPQGWPKRIEIHVPGLASTLLQSLAEDIQNSFSIAGRVYRSGPDFVSMPSRLAVETIIKIFYLEDYTHEIEEQLTAMKPEDVRTVLEKNLGPNSTRLTLLSSDSFIENYRKLGIIAQDSRGRKWPIPQAFYWIVGERIGKAAKRPPIGPKSIKTVVTDLFSDLEHSEPSMREGPFGFGVFGWDDLDPNTASDKLVLRPDLVKRILNSVKSAGLHVISGKAASGKTALAHEVSYYLMRHREGKVFYLDLLNLPESDESMRQRLDQELKLISSQHPTCYIVIDNAHVEMNDTSDLIRSISSTYPGVKVIVTMIPTFSQYYTIFGGNPLMEALEHEELHTVVRGSDIAHQIATNFLRRHRIPLDEVQDWSDKILIIGENLYELQLLLSAMLEEASNKSAEANLAGRNKVINRLNEWDSYRREHVAKHLQSTRDKLGDDGILALAALAVWSQYDISIERNFLLGTSEDQPIGLGISEGLLDYMIVSGDLRDVWGCLRLPHRAIASAYIDTIRSTPAIEVLLRQSIRRKIHMSGEFETNILHAYLQYRPHSIDVISKQICNRGDLLTTISDNPETVDAVVESILVESDVKKRTEIFINFEWLNRKLSEEMMNRLLNSIDRLLPAFKRQQRIAPIIHFVAPMWYVTSDMPEKLGKTLAYDVDWEDISKPVALDTMECQYMLPFDTLDQYRRSVLAKLNESGLSQETKDSYRARYQNNQELITNSSACIKTFLYRRPLLCTKTPMADRKPGVEILRSLGDAFLAGLVDSEPEVIDIAYALSVISYFDQDLARRIIERIDLNELVVKLSEEEHPESAAYCAVEICAINPSIKDSFLPKLPEGLANQLRSKGWTS